MNKYTPFFTAIRDAERRTGQKIDRHELVRNFTQGRTSSIKDLSPAEMHNLMLSLSAQSAEALKADTMRKKIIALLKYCGYTLPDGKADMKRIYQWVLKYGHLHKPLNQYTISELPTLVTQAERVRDSFIKSL